MPKRKGDFMNQANWQTQLKLLSGLVHYIYLSPLPVVAGLYYFYPPSPEVWRADFGTFFSAIALFSGLTVAIAHWIYGQTISRESLEMRQRGVGLTSAASAFRVGMLLCASLGDFTAFLAIGFYLVTRDPIHLSVLLFFWSVHYMLGSLWLRIGRETLKSLSEKQNVSAARVAA